MLTVELDENMGIAILEPDGELAESDFRAASKTIDPYITKRGEFKGIVIRAKKFPGWDSFAALVAHLEFVKGHYKRVSRVALAAKVASHFVNAEIRSFDFDDFEASKKWVRDGNG